MQSITPNLAVKDIDTTKHGMREFYIQDCDGYILGFATQLTS